MQWYLSNSKFEKGFEWWIKNQAIFIPQDSRESFSVSLNNTRHFLCQSQQQVEGPNNGWPESPEWVLGHTTVVAKVSLAEILEMQEIPRPSDDHISGSWPELSVAVEPSERRGGFSPGSAGQGNVSTPPTMDTVTRHGHQRRIWNDRRIIIE